MKNEINLFMPKRLVLWNMLSLVAIIFFTFGMILHIIFATFEYLNDITPTLSIDFFLLSTCIVIILFAQIFHRDCKFMLRNQCFLTINNSGFHSVLFGDCFISWNDISKIKISTENSSPFKSFNFCVKNLEIHTANSKSVILMPYSISHGIHLEISKPSGYSLNKELRLQFSNTLTSNNIELI